MTEKAVMGPESPRPPAVAGSFYDASPEALRSAVERHLGSPAEAVTAGAPEVKALIAPHAGYVYSGPVAGSAFRTLAGRSRSVRRVVLLGPAHYVRLRGLALPAAGSFATPLGEVPVDREAAAAILDLEQVAVSREAHAPEHSLEVELPFLQVMLESFSLVPLVVGAASHGEVAGVLARLWGGDETLIVVSSDLSHYLTYREARRRDRRTVRRILARDATLGPHDACGCAPINGLLARLGELDGRGELLDLRSSGDTAGDRQRVVGYAAVAFRIAK